MYATTYVNDIKKDLSRQKLYSYEYLVNRERQSVGSTQQPEIKLYKYV